MAAHSNTSIDKENILLTKLDIEKLLAEVGSSDKLNLKSRNLINIHLRGFSLKGANLRGADLSLTDLSGANLREVDLSGANLSGADLLRADLSGANLSGANLSGTNFSLTNLSVEAELLRTILFEAKLSKTNFLGANLRGADLSGANLSGTNLRGADLSRTDLSRAILSPETIPTFLESLGVSVNAVKKSNSQVTETDTSSDIRLQINEEPLTAQNIVTIMSAFTGLHTKCWLIAHGRFADLIEYTQTHNERLANEAKLVIVKMTHNSPADINVNVNADASVQGLAEALKTGIDAITQTPHRRKATELENQATELAIKQKELEAQATQVEREQNLQIAAQQAEIARQKALLELQQQQIQVAKQQIGLDRERLELEKNRLEFALETASKMVEMLHPGIDAQTKAMLLQTLIPNLLQTANSQGLVIALPQSKKEETK